MEPSVPKRVLLVDDDAVTRSVLSKLLEVRGFEVIEAESGGSALRLLSQQAAPRLAVVDWNMGTMNGPELCRILRGRTPYVYVVLMTAREGRKPLAEAMNSGADGYIQKPVDADELEAWLVAGQRVVEVHDRLQSAEAELARNVTHDALTGARNRGSLLEILGRELRRSRRTRSPTGVVLVDIDRLRSVNDAHGRSVGDEVLVEFAKRCLGVVRDYDAFGRFGGEEFLAVLSGGTTANAQAVGERMLQALSSGPVPTSAGAVSVGASAGAASSDQGHHDAEALLGAAYVALQQAKSEGGARVRSAEPPVTKGDSDFPPNEPDTMKAPH
jgi:diguanylate cyclase (GGDEF)-like protein